MKNVALHWIQMTLWKVIFAVQGARFTLKEFFVKSVTLNSQQMNTWKSISNSIMPLDQSSIYTPRKGSAGKIQDPATTIGWLMKDNLYNIIKEEAVVQLDIRLSSCTKTTVIKNLIILNSFQFFLLQKNGTFWSWPFLSLILNGITL